MSKIQKFQKFNKRRDVKIVFLNHKGVGSHNPTLRQNAHHRQLQHVYVPSAEATPKRPKARSRGKTIILTIATRSSTSPGHYSSANGRRSRRPLYVRTLSVRGCLSHRSSSRLPILVLHLCFFVGFFRKAATSAKRNLFFRVSAAINNLLRSFQSSFFPL